MTFGQILYGGDDVSGIEWDRRGWDGHAAVRARLLHLAAQACLRIPAATDAQRTSEPASAG